MSKPLKKHSMSHDNLKIFGSIALKTCVKHNKKSPKHPGQQAIAAKCTTVKPMSNLVELPTTSKDLISTIAFNSINTLFLTASWNGYLTIYNVAKSLANHERILDQAYTDVNNKENFDMSMAAQSDKSAIVAEIDTGSYIVDAVWHPILNNVIYTANGDGCVYQVDLTVQGRVQNQSATAAVTRIGAECSLAIQSLVCIAERNLVVAISWDKTLQYISMQSGEAVKIVRLPLKAFAVDANKKFVIVSLAKNMIHLYKFDENSQGCDGIASLENPVQQRESGLKFQAKEIKLSPLASPDANANNDEFFLYSSYEGRIIVDYIDPSPQSQEKKFAFKCHRVTTKDSVDLVYPINSIKLVEDYQSSHHLLYTAGSDGVINLWDLNKKKKLKKLKKFDMPVLKINTTNELLVGGGDGEPSMENGNGNRNGKMLAIVVGDDQFKNNRYLESESKRNVHEFNCKVYLKSLK